MTALFVREGYLRESFLRDTDSGEIIITFSGPVEVLVDLQTPTVEAAAVVDLSTTDVEVEVQTLSAEAGDVDIHPDPVGVEVDVLTPTVTAPATVDLETLLVEIEPNDIDVVATSTIDMATVPVSAVPQSVAVESVAVVDATTVELEIRVNGIIRVIQGSIVHVGMNLTPHFESRTITATMNGRLITIFFEKHGLTNELTDTTTDVIGG